MLAHLGGLHFSGSRMKLKMKEDEKDKEEERKKWNDDNKVEKWLYWIKFTEHLIEYKCHVIVC